MIAPYWILLRTTEYRCSLPGIVAPYRLLHPTSYHFTLRYIVNSHGASLILMEHHCILRGACHIKPYTKNLTPYIICIYVTNKKSIRANDVVQYRPNSRRLDISNEFNGRAISFICLYVFNLTLLYK